MGGFPTGVTVMTSGRDEKAEGMTANAIISVSLEPLMMLASVHGEARINARIRDERYFAINILAAEQEGLSRLFASPERSSGLPAVHSMGGGYGETGSPLVSGATAAIECEVQAVYPGGDHDLFLGRVVAIHRNDSQKAPLAFYRGAYPTLQEAKKAQETGAFMDSARGFDARLKDW